MDPSNLQNLLTALQGQQPSQTDVGNQGSALGMPTGGALGVGTNSMDTPSMPMGMPGMGQGMGGYNFMGQQPPMPPGMLG